MDSPNSNEDDKVDKDKSTSEENIPQRKHDPENNRFNHFNDDIELMYNANKQKSEIQGDHHLNREANDFGEHSNLKTAKSIASSSEEYHSNIAYFVLTACVSFIIGCIVGVGFYIYIKSYRNEREADNLASVNLMNSSFTSQTSGNVNFVQGSKPNFKYSDGIKMNNLSPVEQNQDMKILNNLNEANYPYKDYRPGKII